MKQIFRIISKVVLLLILAFITALIGSYFYIKNSWTDLLTKEDLNEIVFDVKKADKLPDNFLSTTSKVYPDIFNDTFNDYILKHTFSSIEYQPCPCRQVAAMLQIDHKKKKRAIRNFYPLALTWALEEKLTQKECLSYITKNYTFFQDGISIKGIDNASKFMFNNQLVNLTLDEQIELILELKNPILYDRKRRPEIVDKRIEEIKKEITSYNNG